MKQAWKKHIRRSIWRLYMIPRVFLRPSFLDFWEQWKGLAVRSLKKRGVAGTVRHAATLAKHRLCVRWMNYRFENPWYRYLDERFDQRFAVDTAGILNLPELQSDPRFKYAVNYGPTPRSIFFRMMRQLDVDYSKFVFIDFGCGKGKALLFAAELPFQQVIGIELSSKLIRVAKDNWGSYLGTRKCNTVQMVCMDASEYQIPDEPTVYYFYNPFMEEVMRKILENIRVSLGAASRQTYVVYLKPEHRNLLDESGYLKPIKQTYLYSIYKASGV